MLVVTSFLFPSEVNYTLLNMSWENDTYTILFINDSPRMVFYNDSPVLNRSVLYGVLSQYYRDKNLINDTVIEYLKNLSIRFNQSKEPALRKCKIYTYYSIFRCPFKHSCDSIATLICNEFFGGICSGPELAGPLEEFGNAVVAYESIFNRFYNNLSTDVEVLVNHSADLDFIYERGKALEHMRVYLLKNCSDCIGMCMPVSFNWTWFDMLNHTYNRVLNQSIVLAHIDEVVQDVLDSTEARIEANELRQNMSSWKIKVEQMDIRMNQSISNAQEILEYVTDEEAIKLLDEIAQLRRNINISLEAHDFDAAQYNYTRLWRKINTLNQRVDVDRKNFQDLLDMYSQLEARSYITGEPVGVYLSLPMPSDELASKKNFIMGLMLNHPLSSGMPIIRVRNPNYVDGLPRHILMLGGEAVIGYLVSMYFTKKPNPLWMGLGLVFLGVSLLIPPSDVYSFIHRAQIKGYVCVKADPGLEYVYEKPYFERCLDEPLLELRLGNGTSRFTENHAVVYEGVRGACGICSLFSSYLSH